MIELALTLVAHAHSDQTARSWAPGQPTAGDDSTAGPSRLSRRSSVARAVAHGVARVLPAGARERVRKHSKLIRHMRNADRAAFVVMPVATIVYVIVMFNLVDSYDRG